MATSTVTCDACSLHHPTKPPAVWCSECKKCLCTDCKEQHSVAKATEVHDTISIDEYQKLPPYIVEFNPLCDKHLQMYQTYCNIHKSICCPTCEIESHKQCKDVVFLKDVVYNVKNSDSVQKMEHSLDDLTKNIKTIITSGHDNQVMLGENNAGIKEKINQTRNAFNGHLDILEKELSVKLQKASDSANGKIVKLMDTLTEKQTEIQECQDYLQNIKKYATDLQTFLELEKIQGEINKNKEFVQSLIQDDIMLSKRTLHCQIHQSLQIASTDVRCFGEVTTSLRPFDTTLVRREDTQVQMMVADTPSRKPNKLTEIVARAVTPPPSADIGECNKCESSTCMTCKNIQCTRTFRSTSTDESFIIHCTANCETNNVIYLLECAVCTHQYVGQTGRSLTTRVEEHRSDVICKPNNSFSKHFKLADHQDSFNNVKVTIIEHDPGWDIKSRQERESFWIRKLKTLFPNGINKKE